MVYEQVGDGGLTLAEVAIPNGTLYRSRPANGTQGPRYVYSLTDHLGNVRAVVPRGWNPTATPPPGQEWIRRLSFFSDYYPYGWSQPGRDMGLYRYGFQGQEKDPETDWWAFQLRMYDGRIGRWMNFDPKKQYVSPYLALGNNPTSRIDPDGGIDLDFSFLNQALSSFSNFLTGIGNFFSGLFGGSNNGVPNEIKQDFSQQQNTFSNPSEVVATASKQLGKSLEAGATVVAPMQVATVKAIADGTVIPDAVGIEVSGNVRIPTMPTNVGVIGGFGYIRGDGFNLYGGFPLGGSTSKSFGGASLTGFASYYKGPDTPTWASFTGEGANYTAGYKVFTGSLSGSYNSSTGQFGGAWIGGQLGVQTPGFGLGYTYTRTWQLFR